MKLVFDQSHFAVLNSTISDNIQHAPQTTFPNSIFFFLRSLKNRVGKKCHSIILLLSIPSVVFQLVFSLEILTRFLNHLKIRNVLVSSPLISFDELDYWITLGGVKFLPLSTQSKNSDPAWQMLSCFYSKR